MKQDKKINLFVYSLIAILVILIAFFIFRHGSTDQFQYISPSGEEFRLVPGQIGSVKIYTLTAYAHRGPVVNAYEIPFRNHPEELENLEIDNAIRNKILNSTGIYVSLDPNMDAKATIAGIQLAKVLGAADYGVFKIPTQGAFTEFDEASPDYPVINCENATVETRVILLENGDENKATLDGDCVIIEATDSDNLIKVSEKIVYKLLNVM